MPPTTTPKPLKPPADFVSARTDEELIEATKHLHRDQGARGGKRVGAEVHVKNHKGQLVVTSIERADQHAAFLDENPHLFDEPAPADEEPAAG